MKRSDDERRNLYVGDYLICRGCGAVIVGPFRPKEKVYFRNFETKYNAHVRQCWPIKRLIIQERKQKISHYGETTQT